MRYVDRRLSSLIHPYFDELEVASKRRNLAMVFASKGAKLTQSSVESIRYAGPDVRQLRRLFLDKCSYCERHVPGVPYSFRPFTEAEPVNDHSTSHLYYTWLATSWDNWLWVCADCFPDNEAYFPVRGRRAKLPSLDMLTEFAGLNRVQQSRR